MYSCHLNKLKIFLHVSDKITKRDREDKFNKPILLDKKTSNKKFANKQIKRIS